MKPHCLLLVLLIGSNNSHAREELCHNTDEREIRLLFERWNDSLRSGDAKRVVANYAFRSVLLPTVSNIPRTTPEAKEDYFHHFLEKRPSGQIDERTIFIDCNTAIDAGLYTFTFGDGSRVSARYSFTYKWDGMNWLITTHHSSALPEKPVQVAKH